MVKSTKTRRKSLPAPAINRTRWSYILTWGVILAMGVLFFWMNTRPPASRAQLFWKVKVFAHSPDRYCDLGTTIAFLQSDREGHPVAGPCNSPPGGLIHGKGVLWIGRLGLNRLTLADSVWLGFVLAAVFLLTLGLTVRVSRPWHVAYYATLIFSPPIFLGLERGNLDLLIFAALVSAVLLAARYPFVATLRLLRFTRRSWLYLMAAGAGAAVFLFFSFNDLKAASDGPARFAWGSPVIFQLGPAILRAHGIDAADWFRPEIQRFTAVCCLLLLTVGWRWRVPLQGFLQPGDPIARMCFLAGCAIYTGCFIVSVNYEYGNVFILLLVPHLLQATRKGRHERLWAFCGLGVILPIFVLSWYRNDDYPFLANQVFYWFLFCFCAPLCVAAALRPAWSSAFALPVSIDRLASRIDRRRLPYILAWSVVLALGALFFWMNTRPPAERGQLFWKAKVFAHWPTRYCDLGITLAFLQSDYKGFPVTAPCNSPPGVLIYGRGVLWMGRLGLNRLTVDDSVWLGFVLAAAFLLALALTIRVSRSWHALYYALLLFSPPVFLGLERGNLDLLIFIALVSAIILAARYREEFAYAVLFVVGTWKFYPFVAVLALLRPARRSWLYAAAFGAGAALFFLFSVAQAGVAASIGPARFAWGAPVIFQLGPGILRAHGFDRADWFRPDILRFTAACCLLLLMAGWRWRLPLQVFLQSEDRIARMCLIAGCAIYAGCFAISINYEYRNIFILLIVPYLLLATRRAGYERILSFCGLGVILAVFVLSWYHYEDYPFLAYQVFYWLLFCLCVPLCLAALLSAWSALKPK